MTKPRTSADQCKKVLDAARELGCDEDEAAFESKLRHIAKVKPEPKAGAKPEDDEAPE